MIDRLASSIRCAVCGVGLLAMMAGLQGCVSGANVTSEFIIPKPLIDPVPMTVGLHITQELRDYVHVEDIPEHGKFKIELGTSQDHLFGQVFGSVFDNIVTTESLEDVPEGVSGVIIPEIVEAQLAIPQQLPTDNYEVWIRYSIRIVDSEGQEVHTWRATALGKANKRNYSNPLDRSTQALTDATDRAMRDLATLISFQFTQEPDIKEWIDKESSL